jgi:hypothetical protein
MEHSKSFHSIFIPIDMREKGEHVHASNKSLGGKLARKAAHTSKVSRAFAMVEIIARDSLYLFVCDIFHTILLYKLCVICLLSNPSGARPHGLYILL